jgi:tripartite-type tricarboxylate transporter receptor subunit TctC
MAADRRGGDGTLERLLRGNAVRTTITLTCTLATWLAAWLTTGPIASAQSDHYPARPITLLVPFPPGGSADVVIRPVAAKVADALKQPIVIDNRSGGGGNIAAQATKQAAPDGYTLFLTNMGVMSINPILSPELNLDPVKDFQPITPIISFPHILVVPADSPAKTVADLAALAKSKAGGLSFGSQGVGSGGQILGEMFKARMSVPMVHVPYRGAAPAATDIMAGRLDFLFTSYISIGEQAKAGKLRIIAIGGPKRIDAVPDVPTMAEAGFPGLDLEMWHGMVAPAGTPAPIVTRLNAEFIKATRDPEILRIVVPQATDVFVGSPDEFGKRIASDTQRLGQIIRDAGIKMQQ